MDHVDPARPSQESAQTQPARVVEGRSSPEVVAFGPQGPEPAGWTRSEARPIQRRRASGATSEGGGASSPGAPLPAAVRSQMETSFGADFSGVRTHEGAAAPRLGAVAFTQGQDIHFAPGRLQPDSGAGRELLGHELAHVVQQGAGRVSVPQGKDAPINADAGLEAEADRAGAAAARGERAVVRGSARGLQRKEGGEGGEPPPDEEEEAPPDPMEKKGIHWPAMTQRYYDYLATVAAFDGKQGLWRFFDDLHPGPKATLMGQLVAAGVIPKDAKGNYQPGRGDRFKRAMGIDRISWDRFADMTRAYKAKVETRDPTGGMGIPEMGGMGAMGGGIAMSGSKAISDTAHGIDAKTVFDSTKKLDGGLTASHGLGTAGGALNLVSDGVNVVLNAQGVFNGGLGNQARISHGVEAVNNLASAQQNTTSLVNTTSKLATNNAGVMSEAAFSTAAGVGAIVAGTATLGKGIYDGVTSHQQMNALNKVAEDGSTEQLQQVADLGANQKRLNRDEAITNAVKGAAMITGGALLIALGVTNPVGGLILLGAGILGGINAAVKWWRKRKKKQSIVDEQLNVEDAYQKELKRSPKGKVDRDDVRDMELQKHGFNSVDAYYNFYIDTLSTYLYGLLDQGVKSAEHRDSTEVQEAADVVTNLGLKVDLRGGRIPDKAAIAKRL